MPQWGIVIKRLKKKSEIPNQEELECLTAANLNGELVRFFKKNANQIFIFNESNDKWYEVINTPWLKKEIGGEKCQIQ